MTTLFRLIFDRSTENTIQLMDQFINPQKHFPLKDILLDNTLAFQNFAPHLFKASYLNILLTLEDKDYYFRKKSKSPVDSKALLERFSDPQTRSALTETYNRLLSGIIAEIQQRISGTQEFDYEKDISLGAQAAIRIRILELVAKGGEAEDIKKYIIEIFFPMIKMKEELYGAFLPVGTEVEIWDKAPYTDPSFYNLKNAALVWTDILKLRRGMDELIEFALPPSLSASAQHLIIESMLELGLIPQGWFSLHISCALPVQYDQKGLVGVAANYLELTKALLYTTDARLEYFSGFWDLLAIKGGSGNIEDVNGKKPSFTVYSEEGEVTRVEYRSGDVANPENTSRESIKFIQAFHSMMFAAIIASVDPERIKNKFMQELIEILDKFIGEIDEWQKQIPPRLQALFSADLFQSNSDLEKIVAFRRENPDLMRELKSIVEKANSRLSACMENAESLQSQPADRQSISALNIVLRLKAALPPSSTIKDIFGLQPEDRIDFQRFYNNLTQLGETERKFFFNPLTYYNTRNLADFEMPAIIERPDIRTHKTELNISPFELTAHNLKIPNLKINQELITLKLPWWQRLKRWVRIKLGLPLSREERLLRNLQQANERAYEAIGADIKTPVTQRVIFESSLRDAAGILNITTEELCMRLYPREWLAKQIKMTAEQNKSSIPPDITPARPLTESLLVDQAI